jgi:F-type H+-transporting ATPase subunit alpha
LTELSIRPDEIAEALKKHVESFRPTVTREEVGRVIDTGDGIAHVEGLPSAMANELLEFPGGLLGMALNLDLREIGCIIFGDSSGIEEPTRSAAPAACCRCPSATASSAG